MNVALLSQPQRELRAYLQRVAGDGGTVETPGEASTFIRRLRSAGVLGSTVIAGVAGGVKAGTLYSIIGPDLDVTRGTVKNRVNRAGVLSEVASGVPATDYAGGALRGTTVEPSAVNLALRSEEFDNAYWTPLELTVTPNTTVAPNGETTADTLTESANNAARAISSSSSGISFTSGTVYTFSVFAKFNGRLCRLALPSGQFGVISANFDLQNGIAFNVSGTGARIVDFGNGWYRCSITLLLQVLAVGYSRLQWLRQVVGLEFIRATAHPASSFGAHNSKPARSPRPTSKPKAPPKPATPT
jgi:hypothetical protein